MLLPRFLLIIFGILATICKTILRLVKIAHKFVAYFTSCLLFGWFDPLVLKGYKSVLSEKDLPNIPHCIDVHENAELFQRNWEQHKQNSMQNKYYKKSVTLWTPLIKTFGFRFFVANLFGLFYFVGIYLPPVVSFN